MLIVGHSKTIFTDRRVETSDVWNFFVAAVPYVLHVAESFLRN